MKIKKVNRYYCEYCKKSGCGKWQMERHEKHCTNNPNRECRLCKLIDADQKPISKLIKLMPDIEALREATENCPMCIIATIRQANIQETVLATLGVNEEFEQRKWFSEFNYKTELEKFWEEYNNENHRKQKYEDMYY